MFDDNKMALNHLRASREKNKKVKRFFKILSKSLVDKSFSNLNSSNKERVLELASRNNYFHDSFLKIKPDIELHNTTFNKNILLNYKKSVVAKLENQVFKNNYFDICFCVFAINYCKDINIVFRNVYNQLKKKGVFLAVFVSEDCLKEFKKIFFDFFKVESNYHFLPMINIQTIGNIGLASGFKNVVVDKEIFQLQVKKPEDIWQFIRDIGESNIISQRRKLKIKKNDYKNFYIKCMESIEQNQMSSNTLSFNFFIGIK